MRVVVLGGGESDERDVSASSAAAVSAALSSLGHEVVEVDPARWPAPGAFGLDVPTAAPDPEAAVELRRTVRRTLIDPAFWEFLRGADCTFLALHGGVGESGHLRAACEVQQVRATGADAATVMNAWDKARTLLLLDRAGVPIPFGLPAPAAADDDELAHLLGKLGGDVIVRPVTGGSSIGVSRVRAAGELRVALAAAGGPALVEERLAGPEFTVSVVSDEALPPILIQPADEWFGYRAKYQSGASRELCPAPVSAALDAELRDLALLAARALGFGRDSYARVDIMQDSSGTARCLEVNSLPGLTPNSLLPRAAACHGWSFAELCAVLLGLASPGAASEAPR